MNFAGSLGSTDFKTSGKKGSHILLQKVIPGSTITVPVPNYREIRIGTLKSIIRQSKLPAMLFELP